VGKVEQGIGAPDRNGRRKEKWRRKFEPGTVLALIDERLHAMARTLKEFE